jgi:hypothetical protein
MPDPSPRKFALSVDGFDVSLPSREAQQRGTTAFRDAVKAYLSSEFQRFGSWSAIEVDDHAADAEKDGCGRSCSLTTRD